MRHLRHTVAGLLAAGAMLVAVSGCAAPAYTYAADSHDKAYFKVPSGWHQVNPQSLAQAQANLLGKSAAGQTGGTFSWSRAYAAAPDPPYTSLLTSSSEPVVYATVQNVKYALRGELSFDLMRDLLFPVTPSARQEAASAGEKLTGFSQISATTFTTKYGMRGINELYEYNVGGQVDTFDQTVLTNTATSKLYLLLVQCYEGCFLAHKSQIAAVINSFTVRGP
jgi:hypothetical protein